MSKSRTEPGYAAPSTVVGPEQGPQPALNADANTPLRRTSDQRNPSFSLLSRLFAGTHELDASHTALGRNSVSADRVAKVDGTNHPDDKGNSIPEIDDDYFPESPMAMTIPPVEMAAHRLGATTTSASKLLDMADLRQANSQLMNHRVFLNGNRGRGTSLERTPKEKRVQQSPPSTFSSNPGDTGTVNGPAPRSPATKIPSSDDPSLDGVRANYRSWRDTHPGIAAEKAWSIGEQASGEVPEGQVEKSIAEALAGIEPNNRSRKASHSLRFFRQGLPEEKPKRRETKDIGRLRDTPSRSKNDETSGSLSSVDGDKRAATDRGDTISTSSVPGQSPDSLNDMGHLGDGSGLVDTLSLHSERKSNALPTQFHGDLEKIPAIGPTTSKGSFLNGLRTTERWKSSYNTQQEAEPSTSKRDKREEPAVKGPSDADDESGEEQISSALFVPHKTSHDSAHDSPSELRDIHNSAGRRLGIAEPEQWLEEHEVPCRETDRSVIEKPISSETLAAKTSQTQGQERENLLSDIRNFHEAPHDALIDNGYSTKDEESSLTDDPETTPTDRSTAKHYMSRNQKEHLHHHQQVAKAPLEAIELIPYRHQVGGHTTMWRFSKRAVCKQLNNRENQFYERIERCHPQLLKFMPRYIGVLNVTFEKQQRRKISAKDHEAATELGATSHSIDDGKANELKDVITYSKGITDEVHLKDQRRMISQSINSTQVPTPTVTFADNRHIIPKSLLQPSLQLQEAVRRSLNDKTALGAFTSTDINTGQPPPQPPLIGDTKPRPTLSDKHAASWGATTVNKKLRNEVFGEAFLRQPIPIHRHKRPAHQHRPLLHRATHPNTPSHLRTSNSESNLNAAQQDQDNLAGDNITDDESIRKSAINGAAEHNGLIALTLDHSEPTESSVVSMSDGNLQRIDTTDIQFKIKTARSAPVAESLVEPYQTKRKRRYSSGALRRKPAEDGVDRGDLKYFEQADDATYKGDGEAGLFQMDPETSAVAHVPSSTSPGSQRSTLDAPADVGETSLSPQTDDGLEPAAPIAGKDHSVEAPPITRPVNPKEAQTQPDKRVEFFLLLEDLTAGMRRPCIMDLKMGTRQYGVDANVKKQHSQRRKCAETTSKELGVRVCGLQVWDVATESYIFRDKYFGRDLKVGREFQEALMCFLYDGVDYSSVLRHIPTILHKLSQLEILIRSLRGYRFYAASLLMFYDGETEDEGTITDTSSAGKVLKRKGRDIDFKIADFANCVTAENGPTAVSGRACPPQHPEEPDRGFLRGLRSLRKYFVNIQREVREKEQVRGFDVREGDDTIINGNERINEPVEEDDGEVSY